MDFIFRTLNDSSEKRRVMTECDEAFTISVIGRPFFPELFEKIDKYAVFAAAYTADENVAGYSAFYANDLKSKRAFITLFCVRKEMQRMRLGSKLMELTIRMARENGMKTMGLEVLREDKGAAAFYERCGFVRVISEGTDDRGHSGIYRYELQL